MNLRLKYVFESKCLVSITKMQEIAEINKETANVIVSIRLLSVVSINIAQMLDPIKEKSVLIPPSNPKAVLLTTVGYVSMTIAPISE